MKITTVLLLSTLWICLACQSTTTQQADDSPSTSTNPPQWITFEGKDGGGKGKRIVLISGDEEYRSEEGLPQMAKILSTHHGFHCTVLFAQNPEKPGIVDPNYLHNIPGLEALGQADLMIIATRFRELPDEQMQHIDKYLKAGKPVIGMRTATHAFNIKDSTSKWMHYSNFYKGNMEEWHGGFGRLVLGEKWISHHGHHKHQSTRGLIAAGARSHPITSGIADGDIWGPTDVYGVRLPLPGDAMPVIMGQVINRADTFNRADPFFGMKMSDSEIATENPRRAASGNPNDPMMPVAWTKSYQVPGGQTGKAFATTMGSSTDLVNEGLRRLLINAAYTLTGLEVPQKAQADLIGNYQPSAYSFQSDEYWQGKNIRIAEIISQYAQ